VREDDLLWTGNPADFLPALADPPLLFMARVEIFLGVQRKLRVFTSPLIYLYWEGKPLIGGGLSIRVGE
jgi:hypothetical protein